MTIIGQQLQVVIIMKPMFWHNEHMSAMGGGWGVWDKKRCEFVAFQ